MSESLTLAREKQKALRESGGNTAQKTPIERAQNKPTSLRLAVTAKCWECMGGGIEGRTHTRKAIRECTSRSCPLLPVRPYQT